MTDAAFYLHLIGILICIKGAEVLESCRYFTNGHWENEESRSCVDGCCGKAYDDVCCEPTYVDMIIGAVVGCSFFLILLIIICICFVMRRKKAQAANGSSTSNVHYIQRRGDTTVLVSRSGQPTTHGQGVHLTGTTYTPMTIQQPAGTRHDNFEANPSAVIQPTAPPYSDDPPPYPGTGSNYYTEGGQFDKKFGLS